MPPNAQPPPKPDDSVATADTSFLQQRNPDSYMRMGEDRQRRRWLDWLKIFAVAVTAMSSGGAVVYEILNARVDARIEVALDEHRNGAGFSKEHAHAHVQIQQLKQDVEWLKTKHKKEWALKHALTTENEKALYKIYWFRVGEKAAEAEPDVQLKSRAAKRAREKFENYIIHGIDLEEAYLRCVGGGLL